MGAGKLKQLYRRYPKGSDGRKIVDLMLMVRATIRQGGYRAALESFYWIKDKNAQIHPIKLNAEQVDFLEETDRQIAERGYVRVLVLKARQIGFSTLIQGLQLINSLARPFQFSVTLGYDRENSKYLYGMSNRCYERLPGGRPPMEVDRRAETRFCKPNRSEISVQTAGTVNVGRGTTIQFVHASELAFYTNPEDMFTGFEQAIADSPGTFAFKESTANGAGNYFFREWNNAEAGLSSYVGKFYSWWAHVDYRLPFQSAGELDDLKRGLTKDELALLELGCSFENLKWRRRTIITKCQNDHRRFKQEYPATAQEAFLTSGRPTFDSDQMAKLLALTKRTEPIFTGSLQAIDE